MCVKYSHITDVCNVGSIFRMTHRQTHFVLDLCVIISLLCFLVIIILSVLFISLKMLLIIQKYFPFFFKRQKLCHWCSIDSFVQTLEKHLIWNLDAYGSLAWISAFTNINNEVVHVLVFVNVWFSCCSTFIHVL